MGILSKEKGSYSLIFGDVIVLKYVSRVLYIMNLKKYMCWNPFIDCWLWICVAQGLLAHDVGSHSFLQISYGRIILPDEGDWTGESLISIFEIKHLKFCSPAWLFLFLTFCTDSDSIANVNLLLTLFLEGLGTGPMLWLYAIWNSIR